ncbi:MAG: hypothetical protein P1U87_22125 [Verrucomicrobiales bacterium]|nr:hypothetical protein [Verrucomicrobiales bacterium]
MTDNPPPKKKSIGTWLWNPFTLLAGAPALTAGVIILLITGALAAPTRTHLDGVLDTHIGFDAPIWVFLSEGIINWLCLAIVLWIAGLLLKGPGKFRALDLFGTQALARWPFLLTTLVCYLPGIREVTTALNKLAVTGKIGQMPEVESAHMIAFSIATIGMILVTIWFVALAWKSFRISCDVRGGKAIAAFVIGILLAEALSKFAIMKGLASLIPES